VRSSTRSRVDHRLSEILAQSRGLESELIAHIGEVDARKLYAREASASMFSYCTEELHLSESEAYLRIGVARAAREYPILLEMLADGRLHLSGIAKLAPYLTAANQEALLERATYKSKRKIDELIAEISPQPDVPASIRKLPQRRGKNRAAGEAQLRPDGVEPAEPARSMDNPELSIAIAAPPDVAKAQPLAPEPLSPARYRIQFTAGAEFRDKLERLRALMRSSVPDGDLAALLEVAVTEKLERLEARRFAKTKAPRMRAEETDTSRASRHIPAAVKRAVRERDGDRCTFVGPNGRRCTERNRLEFHHRNPFGKGGDRRPENIYLMCRTHNGYQAGCDYGKEFIERCRRSPSRVSEPVAIYTIGNRSEQVRFSHRFSIRLRDPAP